MPNIERWAARAENFRSRYGSRRNDTAIISGAEPEGVGVEPVGDAPAAGGLGKPTEHITEHGGVEQTFGRLVSHDTAGEERGGRGALNGDVIGVIVGAVRFEGHDHLRLHVPDDRANGRFDVEHVHVGQGVRVVVPLPLLARGIVKSEQHGLLDAELRARQPELFDASRPEVADRTDRRMWFASFTVGGTDERHAHPAFAEVGEDAAVEDLVVWMGQDDEK